jgi:hypothetical protein
VQKGRWGRVHSLGCEEFRECTKMAMSRLKDDAYCALNESDRLA